MAPHKRGQNGGKSKHHKNLKPFCDSVNSVLLSYINAKSEVVSAFRQKPEYQFPLLALIIPIILFEVFISKLLANITMGKDGN